MSTTLSSQWERFRFQVNPKETQEERELRWDAEILTLLEQGLTVQGIGPDGDYPIRYDFDEDGQMTFDEWMRDNTDSPWFEVYDIVPLGGEPNPFDLVDGSHRVGDTIGGLGAVGYENPAEVNMMAMLEAGVAMRDYLFGTAEPETLSRALHARAIELKRRVTL